MTGLQTFFLGAGLVATSAAAFMIPDYCPGDLSGLGENIRWGIAGIVGTVGSIIMTAAAVVQAADWLGLRR